MTTYTVVYFLTTFGKPKATFKCQIRALNANQALTQFINLPGAGRAFVACIIIGIAYLVEFTAPGITLPIDAPSKLTKKGYPRRGN